MITANISRGSGPIGTYVRQVRIKVMSILGKYLFTYIGKGLFLQLVIKLKTTFLGFLPGVRYWNN